MDDRVEERAFDALAAAFIKVFKPSPPDLTANLLLAGHRFHLEVTGRSLARILDRAVSHLVLPDLPPGEEPEFGIYLSEPHNGAAVRLLREISEALPNSWTADPDLEVRSSLCGRMVGIASGRWSRFVLDRERRILVGIQEPERLALFERTKPLLVPLRVLLQDRGVQVAHAGLVASGRTGVLIGGPGRSGKSSAALRCFLSGFDLLGDDQIALTRGDRGMVGHSLYGAVQVAPEWLPRFASFPSHVLDGDAVVDATRSPYEKVALFASEIAPEKLKRSVPIRALVLPRLAANKAAGLSSAGKAEALMRIAPSTLFQPFGSKRDGLNLLRQLVEQVPSYWLDPGDDGSSIPDLVRRVVETVRAR